MSETETDTEAFADGTPLVELFGDTARARMLSVFVDERGRDLSVSELARQAGIARKTVYDHIDQLVEAGAVEMVRETKQGKRYALADSEVGDHLYRLDGVTLRALLAD